MGGFGDSRIDYSKHKYCSWCQRKFDRNKVGRCCPDCGRLIRGKPRFGKPREVARY